MEVISIRGNNVVIELTDQEENLLFRVGLQSLLDRWFGKKVVVLPVDALKVKKDIKTVEVNDEFCRLCVQEAVNQVLMEYLDKISKTRVVEVADRNPKKMVTGSKGIIHKARTAGHPEAICGAKRSRQTSLNWEEVTCLKCRRTS
jgi:hypothetical protein